MHIQHKHHPLSTSYELWTQKYSFEGNGDATHAKYNFLFCSILTFLHTNLVEYYLYYSIQFIYPTLTNTNDSKLFYSSQSHSLLMNCNSGISADDWTVDWHLRYADTYKFRRHLCIRCLVYNKNEVNKSWICRLSVENGRGIYSSLHLCICLCFWWISNAQIWKKEWFRHKYKMLMNIYYFWSHSISYLVIHFWPIDSGIFAFVM